MQYAYNWGRSRLQTEHDRFDYAARRIEHLPEKFIQASCIAGDLYHWKGKIRGPLCSCYRGGNFFVDIRIPDDYPTEPPYMRFATKIFHPNIDSKSGEIWLDVL